MDKSSSTPEAPSAAAPVEQTLDPGLFISDEDPPATPKVAFKVATGAPEDEHRKLIVWTLMLILAAIVLVGLWGWWEWGGQSRRMQNFGTLTAPVITLIGTMMGFYFSSKK